jgi:methylenetetrahydrofolate dehydrogenase (NADP+)/methenyltetrahydrofolate cyclohydrolase
MDVEAVIDTKIRPQLIEAFGRQTANSLLTKATLAYVSTDGTEQERFETLVQTICSDERVLGVWGERGVAERIEDWHLLLQDALLTWRKMKGEETMIAEILDGRAMSKEVRKEIVAEVADFKAQYGFTPTIAVVRVGDDPASVSYGKMIKRSFEGAAMGFVLHDLPDSATTEEVIDLVARLNADGEINGIMVQEPLPRGIDEDEVKAAIRAAKDADGVNPINAGRLAQAPPIRAGEPAEMDYLVPATPLGGLEMLLRAGVEISGKRAVVVGRSNIVGRPMSFLLMQHHATVSMCHSRTRPLGDVTREADILCTAVGVANLIKGDMIKPGAIVIDFGFNRLGDEWVGDVDFEEAREVAGMITPVPGGTGSMTNVMLMRNVLQAAKRQMKKQRS